MTTQELLEEITRLLKVYPDLADREVVVVRKKEKKDHRCKYKMHQLEDGRYCRVYPSSQDAVLVLHCSWEGQEV